MTNNVYVTGITHSSNFPITSGAFDTSYNGNGDAFVTKLDSTGSSLVFSTFLGGSGRDEGGDGIAVDTLGNVYITGDTYSSNFPTTPGAYDTSFNGGLNDPFVTKLSSIGELVYSTFLGGTSWDGGESIAVDDSGNAYVTGVTYSSNFPTTSGAFDTSYNGGGDAFVTKLDSTGSRLVYSTFLGGSGEDIANSIIVDGSGNAYATGYTYSTNFPTTTGAFDTSFNGNSDVFVTEIAPTGSSLIYSTFLGGNDIENHLLLPSYRSGYGGSIALDTLGNIYITGNTYSTDFPTAPGAYDAGYNGGGDAFVTKFSLGGNQAPIANAGPDQTVHVGASVTSDGSGSSDPDGNTPLSFAWDIILKPQGSTAALSDPSVSMPSFTPDVMGDYTIQLVVTDSLGAASAPDTVKISTSNSAPVADAGPDQLIIGSTVQLDGSNSYDLDGDSITYSWSLTQRPQYSTAAISNPSIPNPTFVADDYGNYVATLIVTDSFGATSSPDTVTVSFTNLQPVADAGTNQAVRVGQLVVLDGSGSSDANGDILTYNWSLVAKPMSSLTELFNPTAATPIFIADAPGTYIVSLVVNDGVVNSAPSNITITATSTLNEVVQTSGAAINTINALAPSVFTNPNMRNALTNKINAVLDGVNQELYQEAIDKLQNDILAKTDGCAQTGAPDKNDWIKDCTSQNQVYPLILQAIQLLRGML